MSGIPADFGAGGRGLAANGAQGEPTLETILNAINAVPVWEETITVSTNVAVMTTAGFVVAADGTTGNTTGGKIIQLQGSPAVGFVQVVYDAAGIATLTFNATDAITVAAVLIKPAALSLLP